MKIALLGGTFNPIHLGHIHLADKVRTQFKYDKIIFIPSYIPAHKSINIDIKPEERLEMLRLAIGKISWASYSDCEISRQGISYTVDTLKYITEQYKITGKPGLIIGDDLASSFNSWRNPDSILNMANLIVAHRLYADEILLLFQHTYINNDIYSLSSSDIRFKSENGEDISSYIPEEVLAYIRNKGLYLGENL